MMALEVSFFNNLPYYTVGEFQWKQIEAETKKMVSEFVDQLDVSRFEDGELFPTFDGDGFEQRDVIMNFFVLESELLDVIKEVIEERGFDDVVDNLNRHNVEGFHEFVLNVIDWLSDEIEGDWHVYIEDGDVWIARLFESVEEAKEYELDHLINF